MRELEVALAIALSFLIFSTLASMILEVLFRFSKTRFKGLQRMLSAFYASELSRFTLNGSATKENDSPTQSHPFKFKNLWTFIKSLLSPPESTTILDKNIQTESADKQFSKHILRLNGQNHLLSKVQFVERLATSPMGKVIAAHAKNDVEILIGDIARRYDEYGKAASFQFKQRAEQANMVIAVIIALLLNVNVITLGKSYLDNRALTSSLIAKTEVILTSAQIQQERLEQAIHTESDMTAEALSQSLAGIDKQLSATRELNLPIGWSREAVSYFEVGAARLFCLPPWLAAELNNQFTLCETWAGQFGFYVFAFISWLLTTVVTGLLIGLGGPFWFDMVKRIMVIRTVFGKKSSADTTGVTTIEKENPTNSELRQAFDQAYTATTLKKLAISEVRPLVPKAVRLGKIIKK